MKNNWWKIAVVAALVIVVAIVIAGKNRDSGDTDIITESPTVTTQAEDGLVTEAPAVQNGQTTETADQKTEESTKQPTAVVPEQPIKPENSAKPASAPTAQKNTPAVKAEAVPAKSTPTESKANVGTKATPETPKKLPRLVDLGATKCIPCKMMAPILDELKEEYKGKLTVEFIDVWENPGAGDKYGISSIPTQVFYDENGKEFYRHIGFFPKEDILAKFKENDISLKK